MLTPFDQELMELRRSGQITFEPWSLDLYRRNKLFYDARVGWVNIKVTPHNEFYRLLCKHFRNSITYNDMCWYTDAELGAGPFISQRAVGKGLHNRFVLWYDGEYDEAGFPTSMIDLIKPILDYRKEKQKKKQKKAAKNV